VVLKSPKLEGDKLTFEVTVLEGSLSKATGPASRFIDWFAARGYGGRAFVGGAGYHGAAWHGAWSSCRVCGGSSGRRGRRGGGRRRRRWSVLSSVRLSLLYSACRLRILSLSALLLNRSRRTDRRIELTQCARR
jgi:hypothetical protein